MDAMSPPEPPTYPPDVHIVRDLGPVPWYKKPWGIAAIGGSAAATIAALIALSSGDDPTPPRNGVPGFDFPEQSIPLNTIIMLSLKSF